MQGNSPGWGRGMSGSDAGFRWDDEGLTKGLGRREEVAKEKAARVEARR